MCVTEMSKTDTLLTGPAVGEKVTSRSQVDPAGLTWRRRPTLEPYQLPSSPHPAVEEKFCHKVEQSCRNIDKTVKHHT